MRRPAHRRIVRAIVLVLVGAGLGGCTMNDGSAPGNHPSHTSSQTVPPASAASNDATSAAGRPKFTAAIAGLSAARRQAMRASGTWRPGCPVPLSSLRTLTIGYWGFDGKPHTGRLVVNQRVGPAIVGVFRVLWRAQFPVRRVVPVEAYGGSDERSMRADNTSGYNCRGVAGSPGVWSQHAYGLAVDLNPLENPEISHGVVDPPTGTPYADRGSHAKGMIHPHDVVVRAFRAAGWFWGGYWRSLKDYQHFSPTNR
jgi:D-alanyl-D-alanine carboxypeptidase-like protein